MGTGGRGAGFDRIGHQLAELLLLAGVLLGMGTGDSVAHYAGKRRATLAEVERYVTAVRGLVRDGRPSTRARR